MSRTPKQKTPESGVLRACCDLLTAERIWWRRWNTGAVKNGNRFYRFGKKGDGDILASIKYPLTGNSWTPLILWIECKSNSGKQTEDQRRFQEEVEAQGHDYLVVRDVDTLREWLKERGI